MTEEEEREAWADVMGGDITLAALIEKVEAMARQSGRPGGKAGWASGFIDPCLEGKSLRPGGVGAFL